MTVHADGLTVDWLGYATARLEVPGSPIVYTDPGRYGVLTGEWEDRYGGVPHPTAGSMEPRDGDVVLVTHDHHYQPDGIHRVASPDAKLVVFDAVDAARIAENRDTQIEPPEALPYDVRRIGGDETSRLGDLTIETIRAYNEPDGRNLRDDGTPIHPKGFGCGFVVTLGGRRCCWTGDTDRIAEHDDLAAAVLLLSIARNITMNRHEAAELAEAVRPDLVVPIHYNTFPALRADSRAFAADVAAAGIPVALDET